MTRKQNSLKS